MSVCRLAFVLTLAVFVNCTYLKNNGSDCDDDPATWTERGVWGPLLEEWTLARRDNRNSRVLKIPLTEDGYITTPTEELSSEAKLVNGIPGGMRPQEQPPGAAKPQVKPGGRQVSETDLYLLGAIEKMVFRADFMEKRLRRVEEMLYYVMAGSRMDREPCPDGFMRAGTRCYAFTDLAGREMDWKQASKHCHRQGAVLAEMETIEENQDVVAHIQANSNLRGKDFWTGGLNPGLLWIWSNSARPVSMDNKNPTANSAVKIRGDGRCLRLAYDPALRHYAYRGSDCSARYQVICELPDKSTSNKLNRIARERDLELPDY